MTAERNRRIAATALALLALISRGSAQQVVRTEASLSHLARFKAAGGYTPLGAGVLAMTRLDATSPEKNVYHITEAFPANRTADITFRLTPGKKFTPTAEERANQPRERIYGAKLTFARDGEMLRFRLEYVVPDGVLPVALRDRPDLNSWARSSGGLRLSLASFRASRAAFAVRPIARTPQEAESGTSVIVEAGIHEFNKEFVSTVEEAVVEGAFGEEAKAGASALENAAETAGKEGAGAPASTLSSTFNDVLEALEINAEHTELAEELKELQEMAEEPTNALTEKAYEQDPSLKQSILDEIADVRSELDVNTAMQFVNREISVGIALAEIVPLSVAVSTIAELNGKTLQQVIKERVKDLRKRITNGYVKSRTPPPTRVVPGVPNTTPAITLPKVPTGSWLCTYSATIVQPWTDGAMTNTDDGWFIFKVLPDGSITGEGGGRLTVHGVTGGTVADGGTGYTFKVGGTAVDELDFWTTPEGAVPGEFNLRVVEANGHTVTLPFGTMSPFLFSGQGLKLEHGSVAHYRLVQQAINDTRVMTIK